MSNDLKLTTTCPYCRDSRILKGNSSPIYKCKNCNKLFLSPLRGKPVNHDSRKWDEEMPGHLEINTLHGFESSFIDVSFIY